MISDLPRNRFANWRMILGGPRNSAFGKAYRKPGEEGRTQRPAFSDYFCFNDRPCNPAMLTPRSPTASNNADDGSGAIVAAKSSVSGAKSAIWALPNPSGVPSVLIEDRGHKLYVQPVTGNNGPMAFAGCGGGPRNEIGNTAVSMLPEATTDPAGAVLPR